MIQSWYHHTLRSFNRTSSLQATSIQISDFPMLKTQFKSSKRASCQDWKVAINTLQSSLLAMSTGPLWSNVEPPTFRKSKSLKPNSTLSAPYTRERTSSSRGQRRVATPSLRAQLSPIEYLHQMVSAWIYQRLSSELVSNLTQSRFRRSSRMKRKSSN